MIGKWIVCKRDGREHNPHTATPARIANVTSQAGYDKFNRELIEDTTEYAYFETYEGYFKKRGISLNALPITAY